MSLYATLEEDYKQAFRAGEKMAVEVLRGLKAAFMNVEIDKRAKTGEREAKLTEEEALAVVKRQAKQLEEARDLFAKGGRQDLVAQNEAELVILKKYLPAQVSEEQIREAVKKVLVEMGSAKPGDFGKVMGAAMKVLKGGADGTTVSKVVKELLGG